jgi:hypothetical protein
MGQKKVYKSAAAQRMHDRPQKGKPQRPSKNVGNGKHAHPQPRTSQG